MEALSIARAVIGIIMILYGLFQLCGAFGQFSSLFAYINMFLIPAGIAIISFLFPGLKDVLFENMTETFIIPLIMLVIMSWLTAFKGNDFACGFYSFAAFGIGGLWMTGFIPDEQFINFFSQYSSIVITVFIIYMILPIILSIFVISISYD